MTACPICGAPICSASTMSAPMLSAKAAPAAAPFCSPRCADIDLGRWLTEQYVVTGREQAQLDPDEALG